MPRGRRPRRRRQPATGGPEVGKALVDHRGVDKISFTGSTEVGQYIARASADDFKRTTLELGGKAPSILCADADIDAAVAGNVQGAVFNTGQACGAYTRFFVHSSRVDEFTAKLAAAADSLSSVRVMGRHHCRPAGLPRAPRPGPLRTCRRAATRAPS